MNGRTEGRSKAASVIQAAAVEQGKGIPVAGSQDRLEDLASRVSAIEAALEEAGLENRFRSELSDYIKDLRDEAKFVKQARKLTGLFAAVATAALFITPIVIARNHYKWFDALPPYVEAALLIGMFAAGVVLLVAITKSIFRSAHERHGDEFIPPQIKLIHEMLSGQVK